MPPLLPSWETLPGVPDTLYKFASAPVSFIFGALLSVALGGIETIVESFIQAILAFFGSIEFVATSTASILLDAGGAFGGLILGALTAFFTTVETAVSAMGPGAPIVAAVLVAGIIIVGAYALRFAWTLLVDSINPL